MVNSMVNSKDQSPSYIGSITVNQTQYEGGSPLLFIFPLSLRERGIQGVRAKK